MGHPVDNLSNIQGYSGGRAPGFGWHGFWCFTFCPILLGQMGAWRNWLGSYRLEHPNQSQFNPTQVCDNQSHPVQCQFWSAVPNERFKNICIKYYVNLNSRYFSICSRSWIPRWNSSRRGCRCQMGARSGRWRQSGQIPRSCHSFGY